MSINLVTSCCLIFNYAKKLKTSDQYWRPPPMNSLTTMIIMPQKKTTVSGAILPPLDTNQDRILSRDAQSQKRRLPAQPHKMRSWIKRSTTLNPYTNKWRKEEKKCIGYLSCKRRLTKQLKRCDTSRMILSTKSIDNTKETFDGKAPTMKTCSTKLLTITILPFMMPLL
jgi:hypothetical protein